MHYGKFSEWVREGVEDLVGFGVPRAAAEAAMHYVEIAAISAEADARKEDQLLLDFKTIGGRALAERLGVSQQAVWKRRAKILKDRSLVVREVAQKA